MPAITAWDFGGVLPWTRLIIITTLLALSIILLPIVVGRQQLRRPATLLIPALAMVAWAAISMQTIRWPENITHRIAPGSATAYFQWIPQTIRDEAADPAIGDPELIALAARRAPVSIAPWFTWQSLTSLAAFAATLLISMFVFQTKRFVVALLACTACAGAALAFVASVNATYRDSVFSHLNASADAKNPFGPFINANNAAGYLNIALACGIGWLSYLVVSHRDRYRPEVSLDALSGSWWDRVVQSVGVRLWYSQVSTVIALLVCAVIVTGVVSSGSRGALLGTITGLVALAAFGLQKRYQFRTLTTIAIGTAAGAVIGLMAILSAFQSTS